MSVLPKVDTRGWTQK